MKDKYRPNRNIVCSLFKAIKELRKMSKYVPENIKKSMSDVMFKKEFLTFRIQIPRRLGNTAIAKKLMEEYKASVYVTGPYWRNMDTEFPGRCFSVRNYAHNLKDKEIDLFIVDCASDISSQDIETMYNTKVKNYVFLG
jgi:hypothetical protein